MIPSAPGYDARMSMAWLRALAVIVAVAGALLLLASGAGVRLGLWTYGTGFALLRYAASEGGITRIKNILPPVIAVPTTAGPGSEVGRSAAVVRITSRSRRRRQRPRIAEQFLDDRPHLPLGAHRP